MKKLLLFAILAAITTVNAQHTSKDFKAMSPRLETANYCDTAVTSNIIPVPGADLPLSKSPAVEERNATGFDSDIIPVPGYNRPHTKSPAGEERNINGFPSDIIPVPGYNRPHIKNPVGEERNINGFSSDIIPVPGADLPHIKFPENEETNVKAVNSVAIGQSGNAFGFAFTRTTYLWADNNINTIAFMHRMTLPPGTGYLAYDLSKDGGQSWQSNIQTYNPTLEGAYDGRYPQGAIYNPPGNTNPDEAYYHYFAPTLDGSNTGGQNNWGGYAYGVKKLEAGSASTQHNRSSLPPYYQYLPDAFTITQAGDAWMVDENSQGNISDFTYLDELIIGHGTWDSDLMDFVYDFNLFPLEVSAGEGINDINIAFAPDGMTGYILVMTILPDVLPYTNYHPVLFKTTDGGETWSSPIEVQLGGTYGLEPVQNYITDENLASFYDPDPVPLRDQIDYWMGYECDLSVDAWGNPHIIGLVTIADNSQGLIYASEGLMAMFHIWSDDQGGNWEAFKLGDVHRFDADFANGSNTITMHNRPQVATTQDGAIVFFSWIDTEVPEVTDNSQPDIFFRDYIPALKTHGEAVENVTLMSAGMWSSYFACMSHYVFSEVDGENYTCTIPFVYEQLGAGNDPTLPVQFYYIPDFVKTYTLTGMEEVGTVPAAFVSQNSPNPFSTFTNITVNLMQDTHLLIEVYNLTGSMVEKRDMGTMKKGMHTIQLSADGLSKGIYFYSVITGNSKITKKMLVQ